MFCCRITTRSWASWYEFEKVVICSAKKRDNNRNMTGQVPTSNWSLTRKTSVHSFPKDKMLGYLHPPLFKNNPPTRGHRCMMDTQIGHSCLADLCLYDLLCYLISGRSDNFHGWKHGFTDTAVMVGCQVSRRVPSRCTACSLGWVFKHCRVCPT